MVKSADVTLLYVEKDKKAGTLFKKRMASVGYDTVVAQNAVDAMKLYSPRKHSMVVTGYNLGDKNGLEFIEELSRQGTLPPIIMLAEDGDGDVATQALNLGAIDFMLKDDKGQYLNILPAAVRSALNKVALMKQNEEQQRQLEFYARELEESNVALRHRVNFDTLTGLISRDVFYERIGRAISRCKQHNALISIMYVDIDEFKSVNDAYGHMVGDDLLKGVAYRLKESLRENDTVARLGGDEFGVITEAIKDEMDSVTLAQRIVSAMNEIFYLGGGININITVSIGIATYPECGETVESLVKSADVAMYKAKQEGRNAFQFYSSAIDDEARERLKMEQDLRFAVDRDELVLYYQPQFDMHSGAIIGAEALVRWDHPQRGLVPPNDFIPLAEKTGLIVHIGEWVLNTACAQSVYWDRVDGLKIPVSVNLSANQFKQVGLPGIVKDILDQNSMLPEFLSLEITEGMLIDDVEQCNGILTDLNAIGAKISIDDFGKGYSSLNYLKNFPLSTLKIDKSFVDDITTNNDDRMIAKTIIDLGHNLNLKVVAEGVETKEQFDLLKEMDCDHIQGYLLARPMPAEEISKWHHEGKDKVSNL